MASCVLLADVEDSLATSRQCIEIFKRHMPACLQTGVQRLVRIVLEALWTKFVGPVLLWPLLCHRGGMPLWAAGRQRSNPGVSTSAAKAAADGPAGIKRSASTSTLLPSGQAFNALELSC